MVSIVSKMTGIQLDFRSIVVQFAAGNRNVLVPRNIPSGAGAHPASYEVVKRQGRQADRPISAVAKVKNSWSCTSIPPDAFVTCTGKGYWWILL
jgi:hypothetical protein